MSKQTVKITMPRGIIGDEILRLMHFRDPLGGLLERAEEHGNVVLSLYGKLQTGRSAVLDLQEINFLIYELPNIIDIKGDQIDDDDWSQYRQNSLLRFWTKVNELKNWFDPVLLPAHLPDPISVIETATGELKRAEFSRGKFGIVMIVEGKTYSDYSFKKHFKINHENVVS